MRTLYRDLGPRESAAIRHHNWLNRFSGLNIVINTQRQINHATPSVAVASDILVMKIILVCFQSNHFNFI